jgi:hypothetical protein
MKTTRSVGTNCNLLADSTINCQTKLLQDVQMSKTSKSGAAFAYKRGLPDAKNNIKRCFLKKDKKVAF